MCAGALNHRKRPEFREAKVLSGVAFSPLNDAIFPLLNSAGIIGGFSYGPFVGIVRVFPRTSAYCKTVMSGFAAVRQFAEKAMGSGLKCLPRVPRRDGGSVLAAGGR